MARSLAWCFVFCCVGLARGVAAPALAADVALPDQSDIFKTLRPEHPRLLATRADFARLAERCQADKRLGGWLARLRASADKLLTTPPVKYEIPDGKRLLSVSREAKHRLLLLGLLWRVSGERKYADRAWTELATIIKFKDWNPSHFLDTAEMTCAAAIGLDWLHDAWSQSQRAEAAAAIRRLGFEPALPLYRQQKGFTRHKHNWNQVCNGGLIVGALAVAEAEPAIAAEVLRGAAASLPLAMREFAPDGGWGEGPGYWRYATEYNVLALAALDSALGTDFGLSRLPGFSRAGDFPLHFVGPTGKAFNYADAGEGWSGASQLFWLATKFDRPAHAERQLAFADAKPAPLDLLWGAAWAGRPPSVAADAEPLARCFQGVWVATARGAWNDREAMFVAFKGGDNQVNHGHLDLGSFVLDALGQRWAIDLGPDDYNLPGYFGAERWNYLRNNTLTHNTLVIEGENQAPAARAAIARFGVTARFQGGVIDLTAAYPRARRVERGVALLDKRQVMVQDEVTADRPVGCVWQMFTEAQVELDGAVATLSQGGRRLRATLLAPADARWETAPLEIPKPQRAAPNARKLYAAAKPATRARFAVVFDAAWEGPAAAPAPPVVPLERWPARAP